MSSLLTPFKILVLPLAEFLFLRLLLRYVFGVRIGYVGITDYDFVFPGVIAMTLLLWLFTRTHEVRFQIRRKPLMLNCALVLGFICLNAVFALWPSTRSWATMGLWYPLAIATISSAVFVFVPAAYFLAHPRRRLILPAILLMLSKIFWRTILDVLWTPLAKTTATLTYVFLKPWIPILELGAFTAPTGELFTHLSHPRFVLAVGSGCSGLEGISLLLGTLLVYLVLNRRRHSFLGWIFQAVCGSLFLYLLNIVRLAIFFLITIQVASAWGNTPAFFTFYVLLHNSIGWVIYTGGILAYFRISQTALTFNWEFKNSNPIALT